MSIDWLYQDEALGAVNKPSGKLIHRGWGQDREVLVEEVEGELGRKIYPIHRLDRATSGVWVFALTKEAASQLGRVWSGREAEKRYIALVRGVTPDAGLIDRALPRELEGERVPSWTAYRRLAKGAHVSLVEAMPFTGRAHQIRRHLKHIFHPILGDTNWGDGKQNRRYREEYGLHRLALHAWQIAFAHPITGLLMRITAPLPPDLTGVCERIGFASSIWEALFAQPDEDWLTQHGITPPLLQESPISEP